MQKFRSWHFGSWHFGKNPVGLHVLMCQVVITMPVWLFLISTKGHILTSTSSGFVPCWSWALSPGNLQKGLNREYTHLKGGLYSFYSSWFSVCCPVVGQVWDCPLCRENKDQHTHHTHPVPSAHMQVVAFLTLNTLWLVNYCQRKLKNTK